MKQKQKKFMKIKIISYVYKFYKQINFFKIMNILERHIRLKNQLITS